ncbi:MAG: phosphoribosylformylglycinamidine synthase I [Candidatus Verstraetearchaeota archaeon]|nr:phosphoribosylformylglycinamidine synthase I [Candidatus Verstraetearchaeota archaeon]
MELKRARACVLRVGGTNCDEEIKVALEELGLRTDVVHMDWLEKGDVHKYQLLVFPGGFSYGDYVRAGAVWGKRVVSKIRRDLERFIESGRLVMGICNGFQVLVESGALPGGDGAFSETPKAVLANNSSARYECRWTYLRCENGSTPFTSKIPVGEVLKIPVGHGEGRFIVESEELLRELIKENRVTFRYALPSGKAAEGAYPFNPNGSEYDIAAICNKEGNVMGMMPHPERAFFGWQAVGYGGPEGAGDGRRIFESIIEHIEGL